jgi:WD40 repeat protein
MNDKLKTTSKLFWSSFLLILLLIACGQPIDETLTPVSHEVTSTPSIETRDTPVVLPDVTESPVTGPTAIPSVPIVMPTTPSQMPLDLVPLEPTNITGLEPFVQFTFDMIPDSIADASLVFAPIEYSLAAHLDDGEIIVWDIATGSVLAMDWSKRGGGNTGSNAALALSPPYDEYLATSATVYLDEYSDLQSAVYLWEMDGLGEPVMLPNVSVYGDRYVDPMGVMSLAYSPDGKLLAAGVSLGEGQGGLVRIWDTSENALLMELNYIDEVSEVSFSSDEGMLLIATGNQLVSVDPMSGEEIQRKAFEFSIDGLAISHSGRWLGVYDSQVAHVESSSGETILTIPASDVINALAFSPQESLIAIADGNNIRYWNVISGVEVASYQGQSKYLDVVFFGNGRMIATIDEQTQIMLWGARGYSILPADLSAISPTNVSSLEKAAQFFVPKISDLAFSGESDWLAIGSWDGVYLIDLPSLIMDEFLPQVDRQSSIFSASADGRRLAWVAETGLVKVWDVVEGSMEFELPDLGETCCRRVHLSPNGDILAISDGFMGRIWDVQTKQEIYSREGVQDVQVSPDGTRVAFESARDIGVTIWDITTREDVRELTGYTTAAPYYYTKLSPNWNSMFWAARANMQFTDVESGQLGPEVAFSWGDFTPDGTMVAAVEDGWYYNTVGEVHLIDVYSGESVEVFNHHEEAIVDALAFSPDGRLLATALGETIKIWDVARGTELVTLPNATGSVRLLFFSPDGRILVTGAPGNVIDLWIVPIDASAILPSIDVVSANSVWVINEMDFFEPTTDAVFSPDGSFVAVSTESGKINYWELAKDGAIVGSPLHTNWIYQLAYSPKGDGLVSVSKDGTVRLWDRPTSQRGLADRKQGEVSGLTFFADGGVVATGGQDGTVSIWGLPTMNPLLTINAHSNWVWDVARSPNDAFLASASADRSIKIWKIETDSSDSYSQSLYNTLTGHDGTVWSVDFAPDSRTLASGSWDGTVRLWNVYSGETIHVLEGHTDWVYDVAFSPDGMVLATASKDGTIRLWEVATGKELVILEDHTDRVWSVDFSQDGLYIASASDDGTVHIWGVLP